MARFNPAPGWPPAPVGWLPPAGWQPDPSWPPAPPGWPVVVDDLPTGRTSSRSTTALLVVSIVATISIVFTIPGLPTLIIAIIAKATQQSNPSLSRKLTTAGWIVLVALLALTVVATVIDYASSP